MGIADFRSQIPVTSRKRYLLRTESCRPEHAMETQLSNALRNIRFLKPLPPTPLSESGVRERTIDVWLGFQHCMNRLQIRCENRLHCAAAHTEGFIKPSKAPRVLDAAFEILRYGAEMVFPVVGKAADARAGQHFDIGQPKFLNAFFQVQ